MPSHSHRAPPPTPQVPKPAARPGVPPRLAEQVSVSEMTLRLKNRPGRPCSVKGGSSFRGGEVCNNGKRMMECHAGNCAFEPPFAE